MDKNKSIGLGVIVAILLIVGVGYWLETAHTKKPTTQPEQVTKQISQVTLTGSITSISDGEFHLKNGTDYTIKTSGDTKFLQQIVSNATVTTKNLTFSDLKVGETVVVFFSHDPAGTVYTADRVQILIGK